MAQHRPEAEQTTARRPDLSAYRPPKSMIPRFLWRCKMWVDATFVLSMLERWETFVLLSFFIIFVTLLSWGIYRYLPSQTAFLVRRAQYYFVGTDSNGGAAGTLLSRTKDL